MLLDAAIAEDALMLISRYCFYRLEQQPLPTRRRLQHARLCAMSARRQPAYHTTQRFGP